MDIVSAAFLFRLLNALEASTSSTASESASSKMCRMACIAASLPASWPVQSWRAPAASSTSSLITARTALPMILLTVSTTPIGLIPGHLSRAIKRQAINGASPREST